jgi:hypothetical protein
VEIQPVADVFQLQAQLEEVRDGDVADCEIHVGRRGLLVQVGLRDKDSRASSGFELIRSGRE